MRPFSIAGIQMSVSAEHGNIDAMGRRLELLKRRFPRVRMVLFSELCAFGPSREHAQTLPGPAEGAFQEMAARHGVWLVPGTLYEIDGGVVYNTAPVIDPGGRVIARYRKMFPFEPYEEGVAPGTEFVAFDVPEVGRFGLSICYDMWFPETTRTLAAMGAEVILHPTMTDTIDRDVELSIARASAACNQCYFFDVNGLGDAGVGQSVVIDPSGYVLHHASAADEVFPIEIDLARVRHERETGIRGLGQPLKSFRDRKVELDVYRRESTSPVATMASEHLRALGPLVLPGAEPPDRPASR